MADGYKHNASDKALDKSAEAQTAADDSASAQTKGPGNQENETRKHDDAGKDRLFEGRQQHDEAEKNSEKTRLARDNAHHHHPTDDDIAIPAPARARSERAERAYSAARHLE